jgi:hypothetical protein
VETLPPPDLTSNPGTGIAGAARAPVGRRCESAHAHPPLALWPLQRLAAHNHHPQVLPQVHPSTGSLI